MSDRLTLVPLVVTGSNSTTAAVVDNDYLDGTKPCAFRKLEFINEDTAITQQVGFGTAASTNLVDVPANSSGTASFVFEPPGEDVWLSSSTFAVVVDAASGTPTYTILAWRVTAPFAANPTYAA